MAENNQTQNKGLIPLMAHDPSFIAKSPAMIKRFEGVLGKAAPAFLSGIVAATQANKLLADPERTDQASLFAAGMVGATLNLSFVPSLGQAALVPYREGGKKGKVQFQIMTRGIIQLAQRSGQYRSINSGVVYSDEYDGEDLLTGEVTFHKVVGGYRDQGDDSQIVGFFAYFETVTGFKKMEYWTKESVIMHARKFSKTWDGMSGWFKKNTPWEANFVAMARKTVLKSLLNHYGPMSVDSLIAEALAKDQMVFDSDGKGSYDDNPNSSSKSEAEQEPEAPATEAQKMARSRSKGMDGLRQAMSKPEAPAPEEVVDVQEEPQPAPEAPEPDAPEGDDLFAEDEDLGSDPNSQFDPYNVPF